MVFTGNRLIMLCLFTAFHSVMALPLTEEVDLISGNNHLDAIEYTHPELLPDKAIYNSQNQSTTKSDSDSVFSEQDIIGNQVELLESSDYFETNKPYKRRSQFSSMNKAQKSGIQVSASGDIKHNSGTIGALLNDEIEPEFKAKIKDSLESIKQVKNALVTDSEISYADASIETDELAYKERYLRERLYSDEARGDNNPVAKEKYTASLFREFIDKVISFVMYIIILGIFIKLLMMFIAWQRKLNQY